MRLDIVKFPAPVLLQKAKPVTEFDGKLKQFVDDMFETMYAASGLGLAAPQVAESSRIFVMDCSAGKDPNQRIALINPVIVETAGEQNGEEGCLSFPGFFEKVSRANQVLVQFQDVEGKEHRMEVIQLTARCVLHENDHLDGKVFIERMSPIKRGIIQRKIKKLQKEGEW
ncbi:MAG TPA: peptide deformylase [Blastocatellia bacterium]|nr:peptide deformylase [Blastocatellia bacterium]